MFPFSFTVRANDRTIEQYVLIANLCGTDGAMWDYTWKDGGRATFTFDTEKRRDHFKSIIWLWGFSN